MIEVKPPRCLVVLTEAEFVSLLAHDRNLWARALERGKAVLRARMREACRRPHEAWGASGTGNET